MTAKRFKYKNHKVYDNLTGETHSSNMVSVNVLNELYEENEKLHDEIFRLRTELAYERTKKEKHSYSVDDFKKKLEKW